MHTTHNVTSRAIENGANALAEGFLFGVAALLIIGETWRSSRSQTKRREDVDVRLEELQNQVEGLTQRVDALVTASEERWTGEQQRYASASLLSLHSILTNV